MSDAGTPLVSDPGFHLVKEAILRNITVIRCRGLRQSRRRWPRAGLPTGEFTFAGFLPSRRAARRARLREFAKANQTLIFYEAPRRMKEALRDALDVLGDRTAVIARELTKLWPLALVKSSSKVLITGVLTTYVVNGKPVSTGGGITLEATTLMPVTVFLDTTNANGKTYYVRDKDGFIIDFPRPVILMMPSVMRSTSSREPWPRITTPRSARRWPMRTSSVRSSDSPAGLPRIIPAA